ncbi:3860_t:CDS:1, partial [Funneliformis geosporum]
LELSRWIVYVIIPELPVERKDDKGGSVCDRKDFYIGSGFWQ